MQTVCFETAKLAKEKGFPQEVAEGIVCRILNKCNKLYEQVRKITTSDINNDWSIFEEVYPNRYELLDWLREEHNLHIEILYDYENDNTSYHYTIRTIGKENGRDWKEDYATYEECLETALQEALKMI